MSAALLRQRAPLTVKLGDLVDPLPEIRVAPPKDGAERPEHRKRRRRGRVRASPLRILTAIVTEAVCMSGGEASTFLISVPPAGPGDPTLLFLRRDGETQLMLAVPREAIRSRRLRGEGRSRNRAAEREYEMMRVAEALSCDDALPETDYDDTL